MVSRAESQSPRSKRASPFESFLPRRRMGWRSRSGWYSRSANRPTLEQMKFRVTSFPVPGPIFATRPSSTVTSSEQASGQSRTQEVPIARTFSFIGSAPFPHFLKGVGHAGIVGGDVGGIDLSLADER